MRKTAKERLAKEFALIDVIGVTGQNARNLYIDKEVNAVRKNKILQHYLEETFKMPLEIPANTEEAAFGATVFIKNIGGQ